MDLYEVTVEGQELTRILEEMEGELTPELEVRMDRVLAEGKRSIEAALYVRRNLESHAEECRQEAERLWARAKSFEQQKDHLSQRILWAVDFAFSGKLKTARFTAWGQTYPGAYEYSLAADVDIIGLHQANPKLVRLKAELSKSSLNELVRDGGIVPREVIVEKLPDKRGLRVR
jgi:hypothetical protein